MFNKKEKISYAKQNDAMKAANKRARDTFKYFWREMYWEYRRIIPGLDFGMVKIPFAQEFDNGEVKVEHMWINGIYFDGDNITGELVNEPMDLTNIEKGAVVSKKIEDISDWMFSSAGKTYGGFTIQLMRSQMKPKELKTHDKAWRLDFGDYNDIQVVMGAKENPENLVEHPMSKNMKEQMVQFLRTNPEEVDFVDDDGLTFLHREAIAGNKTTTEVLLEFGADKHAKSASGKTAYDYAKMLNWEHLLDILKI